MSLEELRVLDLSDGVAGAYCTKLFAGYGADVIVLEPRGGHPLRREGPFLSDEPNGETSALWLYLAGNKRSVTLDAATEDGQTLFRRLLEEAQVVVESFKPGHLESLGLGFRSLVTIKRRIVLVSITPFGQTGPRAHWRAGGLASAGGGLIDGRADRPAPEARQAEYQAGLQAFAAGAVAAFNADAIDIPQHVDISIQECLVSALGEPLAQDPIRRKDSPAKTAITDEKAAKKASVQQLGPGIEVEHPVAGKLRHPAAPFRLSEIGWTPGQAPLLGEHNEAVFCGEIGLSREELGELQAAGVV